MQIIRTEVPDVRLVVTGQGDYKPELLKLTRRLHLDDCVEFTGFIPREKKAELCQRAQILVNPSAKEGWGLSVIEANACGTPVVAAAVPGLRDSVIDGETGLLYPHSDITALARAVTRLLKDDNLRKKLGERSLAWSKEFTWQKASEKVEEIIERILRKHRAEPH
jgi:glycosyltransferase involved in cell wall biosynthesis